MSYLGVSHTAWCGNCGEEFSPTEHDERFCSWPCLEYWSASGMDDDDEG